MIETRQFCAIATSEKFREWLKELDSAEHDDLIAHLVAGKGCGANTEYMIGLFDRLKQDVGRIQKLDEWFAENFPPIQLLKDKNLELKIGLNAKDVDGIFDNYDPTLHTLPRRLIVTIFDAAKNNLDLNSLLAVFCMRQGYCDYLITSDRAYIEYLPEDLKHLIPNIPDHAWQIPKFRKKSIDSVASRSADQ